MRGQLPILVLAGAACLGSAVSAGQAEAWAFCQPRAERMAEAGGHYHDYTMRYDMALDACMTAYRPARYQEVVQVPGMGTLPVRPRGGCYPGAPTMYRGTLYCFD